MKHDWPPEQVKQALRDAGTNTCALAKKYGMSRQVMSMSLRRVNTRCELRIADALGIPPQHIWPSRYQDDGRSVIKKYELKPIPQPSFHSSAKFGAGNGNEADVKASNDAASDTDRLSARE